MLEAPLYGPESTPWVGEMNESPTKYTIPFNATETWYGRFSASKFAVEGERVLCMGVGVPVWDVRLTDTTPPWFLVKVENDVHGSIAVKPPGQIVTPGD